MDTRRSNRSRDSRSAVNRTFDDRTCFLNKVDVDHSFELEFISENFSKQNQFQNAQVALSRINRFETFWE